MKKILASLGIVLLVAILGVAVVFSYGSYKDLELKKEEAKSVEKKSKDQTKKSKTKNDDNTIQEQQNSNTNNNTVSDTTRVNANNTEVNNEDVRTTEEGDVIKKTKNGIDYVGDFNSPEAEEKYEEDVKSQSGGGATDKEETPNPKDMSDDEFLDAYKEGMSSEDAKAVDDLAKDPAYRDYLRGQVEARENGQGGNY
ncbi:hypothetical protein [Staphylococcus kloosii]|uniref:hypothetical protein n=1 Tax=Staphylococcus kloosii TaxID=29384 RepID=UPI00189CBB7C|nr:hypothetical protein [Staphylococcus kloosii]MBF7020832.1 hypothetical protein [Staphylococcus kloosii]